MLTPQEVSGRAFTKAMVGGYNMAMVDEFLDELTDDYTSLYKENTALKAKLKVLVEKVEEYRSTEDSMRAALLTAQKMATNIVQDAEKQRDALLAEAEERAREKIGGLQSSVLAQQERLQLGKQELSDFVLASKALCEKQLNFLGALPTLPLAAPSAPEPAPCAGISEIEEQVREAFDALPIERDPSAQSEEDSEAMESTQDGGEDETDEAENPFLEQTRTINLKELKFGRNYNGKE